MPGSCSTLLGAPVARFDRPPGVDPLAGGEVDGDDPVRVAAELHVHPQTVRYRLARLREVMDKAHPTDRPHAYLWFLGVTPEAQGHGIGSRLLKAKLDRLDVENMPAFLETATERNVALYRRHGFDVLSEYRPAPDAPRMWAMWREAAGGGG